MTRIKRTTPSISSEPPLAVPTSLTDQLALRSGMGRQLGGRQATLAVLHEQREDIEVDDGPKGCILGRLSLC